MTIKLYSDCDSKLGSSARVTAPVLAAILSAESLYSDKLKVTASLVSPESSAVAV